MTNPYVIGVPITGSEAFYGREDVFRFVRETLSPRHQNVAVLFGQRRIGKTSILHQLPDRLADEFHSIFFDFVLYPNILNSATNSRAYAFWPLERKKSRNDAKNRSEPCFWRLEFAVL